MGKTVSVPIDLKGLYLAGDPASAGGALDLHDCVFKGNRIDCRPAVVDDTLVFISGLANWQDQTNKVTRLVAFDTSQNLYLKATSGHSWSGAIAGTPATKLCDWANLKGQLFYSMSDGAVPVPVMSGFCSFNGTAVNTSPLLPAGVTSPSTLYPRALAAFNSRLFLGNITPSITDIFGADGLNMVTNWTATGCVSTAAGGGATYRVTPTATTGNLSLKWNTGYTAAINTQATPFVVRVDLRGVDPAYDMPMRIESYISTISGRTTVYGAGVGGKLIVPNPANGFRYRLKTAGTTAAAEPAWPVTAGTDIADGTCTWTCDGPDFIASQNILVPNATDNRDFSSFWLEGSIPIMVTPTVFSFRYKFGWNDADSWTRAAIDTTFNDPQTGILKQSRGAQWTMGSFKYPFAVNTSLLSEDIYWSEPNAPADIRASAFYKLNEVTGPVTALKPLGGRLIAFKREAFWVFQGSADPDVPISREVINTAIGCVGPEAFDTLNDTAYFVGATDIYKYRVGEEPVPIGGDGMRDALFQGSLPSTSWRLSVDPVAKLVIVNTPFFTYAYDIIGGRWTVFTLQICSAIRYNPNTACTHLGFGSTLTAAGYLDFGANNFSPSGGVDPVVSGIAQHTPFAYVKFELPLPEAPLGEVTLEELRVRLNTTSHTITARVVPDGGTQLTKSCSLADTGGTYKEVRIPIYSTGRRFSVQVGLISGNSGDGIYSMSPLVEARIHYRRPYEIPLVST